jgi:uncharacterized protein
MLKDVIASDINEARKARDSGKVSILTTLKGEIERKDDKSDASVIQEVKKMVQNIQTTTNDQFEMEVLSTYLPKQLTVNEMENIVKEVVEANGYNSMKDMKLVMKHFESNYSGQYDGKALSGIVKNQLM